MEKLQPKPGVRETIEAIASSYMRYFTWGIEDGRITTKARDNAISSAENRMGKFLLVHCGDYSPLECQSIYRDRDSIEKAFRTLKTDLDLFPLKKKESTIRETIFKFFLSLIVRNALLRGEDLVGPDEEVFPGEDAPGT